MDAKKRSLRIVFHGFDDEGKKNLLHVLNGRLRNADNTLILAYINSVTDEERLGIRSLLNGNQNAMLVLFSKNVEVAQFAWDVGAFGFVNLTRDNWERHLVCILNGTNKFWAVNSQQQIDVVGVSKITFVLAQGNYSYINFCDRPRMLVTKQLGRIESELKVFHDFERIGKSLIVNMSQIRCIKDGCVCFYGNDIVRLPKNSKSIKLLKDRLLWM